MVELMIVLTILTVAMGMYASTVISTAKLRAIHRETSTAAEAARATIERMHNVPLSEVFATFNSWDEDDPAGTGTSPGAFFSVTGLQAIAGGSGFVGEIILPSHSVLVEGELVVDPVDQGLIDLDGTLPLESTDQAIDGNGRSEKQSKFKSKLTGGEVSSQLGSWQEIHLREDIQDEKLGLPRDLNGDNVIDGADHSHDYVIIPVRVRLTWQGRQGERSYELSTMLTEFRRAY